MIYRTRPLIGVEYASRHAPGFPQQDSPVAFLADSTGHWGTIRKSVRTEFSSTRFASCLWRTRPAIGVRYASRYASGFSHQKPPAAFLADPTGHRGAICKPLDPVHSNPCRFAAHLTSSLFTFHYSLKTPRRQVPSYPPGFFIFFRLSPHFILTFIYLCSILSHRQSSM